MQDITVLSQSMLAVLEHDLTLPGGRIVPAGSPILVLPETLAQCVLMSDGKTLAETMPSISREGHSHAELISFSEQLIRISSRMAALEGEK